MKKCYCGGEMRIMKGKTPDGVKYRYHKCKNCGQEVVELKQLYDVAHKYRIMKKFHVRISEWGSSLGIRFPKALVGKYHLKKNREVIIIPEDNGVKIIPS